MRSANIEKGTRIFGSRFVDTIEETNTDARHKSSSVAQNYEDEEAAKIATKSLAVRRFTQRLLLLLVVSMKGMSAHS